MRKPTRGLLRKPTFLTRVLRFLREVRRATTVAWRLTSRGRKWVRKQQCLPLEDLEVDADLLERLRHHGITSTCELLAATASPAKRRAWLQKVELSEADVAYLLAMADVLRIPGMDIPVARALVESGAVRCLQDLREWHDRDLLALLQQSGIEHVQEERISAWLKTAREIPVGLLWNMRGTEDDFYSGIEIGQLWSEHIFKIGKIKRTILKVLGISMFCVLVIMAAIYPGRALIREKNFFDLIVDEAIEACTQNGLPSVSSNLGKVKRWSLVVSTFSYISLLAPWITAMVVGIGFFAISLSCIHVGGSTIAAILDMILFSRTRISRVAYIRSSLSAISLFQTQLRKIKKSIIAAFIFIVITFIVLPVSSGLALEVPQALRSYGDVNHPYFVQATVPVGFVLGTVIIIIWVIWPSVRNMVEGIGIVFVNYIRTVYISYILFLLLHYAIIAALVVLVVVSGIVTTMKLAAEVVEWITVQFVMPWWQQFGNQLTHSLTSCHKATVTARVMYGYSLGILKALSTRISYVHKTSIDEYFALLTSLFISAAIYLLTAIIVIPNILMLRWKRTLMFGGLLLISFNLENILQMAFGQVVSVPSTAVGGVVSILLVSFTLESVLSPLQELDDIISLRECPACGYLISDEEARFCPKCGQDLSLPYMSEETLGT